MIIIKIPKYLKQQAIFTIGKIDINCMNFYTKTYNKIRK